MHRFRFFIIGFICSILSYNLFASKVKLESVNVQLKWFYQYQFAGIIMAKEKGFYEDFGLDVTIKERNPKLNNIQQVLDGESQYGVADAVILRYRAEGKPVKVLATIFQHNAMVLLSKKGSGIISPYEIRGKKIAYQVGLDDSTITSLLEFAKLSKQDYTLMPMDYTHMDFVNGNVDVTESYVSNEPYWLKKEYGIDVNIIDPKNYGIDFYGDLIFTTEKEIENHPSRVKKFKNATLKGWKYALENTHETIETILKKYNSRNLTYDKLDYEAKITKNLIAETYIPLGTVQKERFMVLADLYSKKGVSKTKLDDAVENIIYSEKTLGNTFNEYIYPVVIVSSMIFLIALFLFFHNRQLRYMVNKRTQELEKAKNAAEQAAKTKAIFLANMSHEIRTPMNAIMGFVDQLLKIEEDKHKKNMLNIMKNSSQNLLSIINDILDLSKIEKNNIQLHKAACDFYLLLYNTTILFQRQCEEKQIEFTSIIGENVPECIEIDDLRVTQILTNLLSNAIKFTPENGKISIDVQYSKDSNMIQIDIHDTGIGISQENIKKIFLAFEQADSTTTKRFGGTGLGLAISKQLAVLMGGNINVSSALHKGSTFHFSFPFVRCSEPLSVEKEENTQESNVSLEGKALIVEDNKTNQLLLSMILDELGIDYEVANNGKEAVDIFYQGHSFDIVFMDENMPEMNGVEAVKEIRLFEKEKNCSKTPIVAVTANALEGDKEYFINAGMDDYVSKPYDENHIKTILIQFLQK